MDMNALVRAHLKIRDARREIAKEFEAKDSELKEKQHRLEMAMLSHLNDNNMDSVRTDAGTFYRQENITPAGADWQAFYDWVKDNDAFDALERRIKKGFIKEYMEEHDGDMPPGVTVHKEHVIRVRRS